MRSLIRIAVAGAILAICLTAHAQDAASIPSGSMVIDILMTAMTQVSDKLAVAAVGWLSGLMILQYTITNSKLLFSGADLEAVMAKFVASIAWFSFCLYVMANGPDFINRVGTWFFNTYAPNLPSPGTILATTLGTATGLFVVAAAAGAANNVMGQVIMYVTFAILGMGIGFAVKLLMIQVELGVTVVMAPFSFSFLGLQATRDQGIAPFKSLITLMYRIALYGIFFAAFAAVANAVAAVSDKYSGIYLYRVVTQGWTLVKAIMGGLVAYAVLAVCVYKADTIAANAASGSTSLGSGDAAAAAMAGAAAGAALNGAAREATKPAQSMTDWMKQLGTSGQTGMRNASPMGDADLGAAPLKPDLSSHSLSSTSGADSGAPSAALADAGSSTSPPPSPGASEGGQFGGVPNTPPDAMSRDSARDAAREERRRQGQTGSGMPAATIGGGNDLTQKVGDLVDALNNPKAKGLGDRLHDLSQHVAQEKATTHVSVNTHHD